MYSVVPDLLVEGCDAVHAVAIVMGTVVTEAGGSRGFSVVLTSDSDADCGLID